MLANKKQYKDFFQICFTPQYQPPTFKKSTHMGSQRHEVQKLHKYFSMHHEIKSRAVVFTEPRV